MKKYNNVLIINSGGGLGDTLQFLPIINFLNKELSIKKIFYFSNKNEFFFNNILKDIKPNNLHVIDFLSQGFGFKIRDIFYTRKILKKLNIKKFDLIIDNQTRFGNSLVFKSIKHDEYISPCINYLFSKPFFFLKKEKNIVQRIVNYFEKKLKKKIYLNYNLKNFPYKYKIEAKKLLNNNNKYIGYSILAGHPTRLRNFNINEIIKVANYFSNKFIPVFYVEKKFKKIINYITKKVPKAYFPEFKANQRLKNPLLVTALGNETKFNISINNGIMHMLSLSQSNLIIFFDENSDKFKPLRKKIYSYDCKKQNTSVEKLKSHQIINYVKTKIAL